MDNFKYCLRMIQEGIRKGVKPSFKGCQPFNDLLEKERKFLESMLKSTKV